MTPISLYFHSKKLRWRYHYIIFCALSRANVTMPLRYHFCDIFFTLSRCWSLFTFLHNIFFPALRAKEKLEVNVRSHLTGFFFFYKNSTVHGLRTDKCSRLFLFWWNKRHLAHIEHKFRRVFKIIKIMWVIFGKTKFPGSHPLHLLCVFYYFSLFLFISFSNKLVGICFLFIHQINK